MKSWLLVFVIFFQTSLAHAGVVHLNTLYFSDGLTTTADSKVARTQWDFGLGYFIGGKKKFLTQFVYGSYNSTDSDGTNTVTYAGTDMGLNFGYVFGRGGGWIVNLAYMFISKAKYNDGAGTEIEWRGTALKADFGYLFNITDGLDFSAKLFYYAPTFNEEVSTTTLTKVSYKRVVIYPGLSMLWDF